MRNRVLREGFFRNYELAQLPPLARILFEGLWCLADKNGRLWDRPQQIKAECLPYDDCDVENLLDQLASSGFISRYKANDRRCIQVVNFEKHQILTSWEKNTSSDIPASKDFKRTSKRLQNRIEGDQKSVRSTSTLNININDRISNDRIGEEENNTPPFHGDDFLSALAEYERHRREKRTALTPTGRRRLYKKLQAFGEHAATLALLQSVEHGWTGVFEPRENGTSARKSKVDSSMEAVRSVIAQKEAQRDAAKR